VLLSFLLTLLAGLMIVSAAGELSSSWPSLGGVSPELRDSLLLSIFFGLLFLKVWSGPDSTSATDVFFQARAQMEHQTHRIFVSVHLYDRARRRDTGTLRSRQVSAARKGPPPRARLPHTPL
jgi:hypothetical protein